MHIQVSINMYANVCAYKYICANLRVIYKFIHMSIHVIVENAYFGGHFRTEYSKLKSR